MTDHPLTETDAAEMWDEHHTPAHPILRWSLAHETEREATLALLRAAFDAGREHERTNPEDDRPWEPLNGPVRVGDEVRRDHCGIITTGVVARVDEDGDPLTVEGYLIGLRDYGTWHVRRAVQELPTNPGAVIIPADGHEYIEATMRGETVRAREATRSGAGGWYAAWRSGEQTSGLASSRDITPGTWKVADR